MTYVGRIGIFVTALFMVVACQGVKDSNSTSNASDDSAVADPSFAIKEIVAPVTIKYTGRSKGKAPYRNYHFDFTLRNSRDISQWYILPYYGGESISNDIYNTLSDKILQVYSYQYDGTANGGKGVAVKVAFVGAKRFIAFRIRRKSTIRIRDLIIPARDRFDKIQVVEANNLWVDSKEKLEKWLPYKVYTDNDADILKGTKYVRLGLVERGTKVRRDFPKGGIKHIWVEMNDKWDIEIEGM